MANDRIRDLSGREIRGYRLPDGGTCPIPDRVVDEPANAYEVGGLRRIESLIPEHGALTPSGPAGEPPPGWPLYAPQQGEHDHPTMGRPAPEPPLEPYRRSRDNAPSDFYTSKWRPGDPGSLIAGSPPPSPDQRVLPGVDEDYDPPMPGTESSRGTNRFFDTLIRVGRALRGE